MKVITAGHLRAKLGEVLDEASAGERVVIERDHRAIAALVPIEDAQQLDGRSEEGLRRKLAAMDRIRERAEDLKNADHDGAGDLQGAVDAVRWDRDHGHDDGA